MKKKLIALSVCASLTFAVVTPAFAWRSGCYPGYGYGYGFRYGVSPGYAAGAAGGAMALGLVAALLIGSAIKNRNNVEKQMLDSAASANQYENYLIGLQYYNSHSTQPVTPLSKEKWIRWRTTNGLNVIQ